MGQLKKKNLKQGEKMNKKTWDQLDTSKEVNVTAYLLFMVWLVRNCQNIINIKDIVDAIF